MKEINESFLIFFPDSERERRSCREREEKKKLGLPNPIRANKKMKVVERFHITSIVSSRHSEPSTSTPLLTN